MFFSWSSHMPMQEQHAAVAAALVIGDGVAEFVVRKAEAARCRWLHCVTHFSSHLIIFKGSNSCQSATTSCKRQDQTIFYSINIHDDPASGYDYPSGCTRSLCSCPPQAGSQMKANISNLFKFSEYLSPDSPPHRCSSTAG